MLFIYSLQYGHPWKLTIKEKFKHRHHHTNQNQSTEDCKLYLEKKQWHSFSFMKLCKTFYYHNFDQWYEHLLLNVFIFKQNDRDWLEICIYLSYSFGYYLLVLSLSTSNFESFPYFNLQLSTAVCSRFSHNFNGFL